MSDADWRPPIRSDLPPAVEVWNKEQPMEPTHELSAETESRFRTAIGDALGAAPDGSMADAVMEQIRDLLVAIDANADKRGYDRGMAEGVRRFEDNRLEPMLLSAPEATKLTVVRGGVKIVEVQL